MTALDFSCSDCSASLAVDSPTYEELLVHGCFVCEEPVSSAEFTPAEAS